MSSYPNLHEIFTTMTAFSKRFRKRYPDEDFHKPWQSVVEFLDNHDQTFSGWNKEVLPGGLTYATFTKRALDLPEKIITGNREE